MEWYFLYPILIAGGFAAGFINMLAGSGSLVTLPILMLAGLPANIANGTNRIAILLQNVVGVKGYADSKLLDKRGALLLGIPAILGAMIGAQIAVNLNEEIMKKVIGIVMLVMLVIIIVRPKRWLVGQLEQIDGSPGILISTIFFLIGIYGGFIQAGVGIFLLAGLVLGVGYDIVRANAVKVAIGLIFTAAALIVFLVNEQVDWSYGLILAVGNMSGAWVATRFAAEKGVIWVRRLLILIVGISAIILLDIL